MIYVNKIENRITCEIKTGYYLDLLTPEAMKLLGSAKSKANKGKNGASVPHLEITKVILAHCNIVNRDYQKIQGSYVYVFLIKHVVKKIYIFKKLWFRIFDILNYGLLIKILNHYW